MKKEQAVLIPIYATYLPLFAVLKMEVSKLFAPHLEVQADPPCTYVRKHAHFPSSSFPQPPP